MNKGAVTTIGEELTTICLRHPRFCVSKDIVIMHVDVWKGGYAAFNNISDISRHLLGKLSVQLVNLS